MRLLYLLLFSAACTSLNPLERPVDYSKKSAEVDTTNPELPSITAKHTAAEVGANSVAEVKFDKKSFTISEFGKRLLQKTYKEAKAKGEIETVEIMAWADKGFPGKKKDLPKDQQDLATKRNDNLEDFVKGLDDDLDVKKFNLAEEAGLWDRTISSDEAKIKDSLENKSAKPRLSSGIVIFKLKN